MTAENRSKKIIKNLIIILAALLMLSMLFLLARVIYLNFIREDNTVVVPDNLIGSQNTAGTQPSDAPSSLPSAEGTVPGMNATAPAVDVPVPGTEATVAPAEPTAPTEAESDTQQPPKEAASLTLHRYQLADNVPFQVTNALPGDTFVKYYCVKASHQGQITLYFTAEVTQQTKNLSSVMEITITQLDTDIVLYSGPMSQLSDAGYDQNFEASVTNETVAYYKIEVHMPTSAGNDYQAAMLEADFRWSVEDDTNMNPPATGDMSNLPLYIFLLVSSTVVLILLLIHKRKEEENGRTN